MTVRAVMPEATDAGRWFHRGGVGVESLWSGVEEVRSLEV